MALAFFGLTPNDKEVFLEPIFLLMYYMGFTYEEGMKLPIWKRTWFIDRFVKEIEKSQGQSRAAHTNDPTTRTLMGQHRQNPPAKLRRFT